MYTPQILIEQSTPSTPYSVWLQVARFRPIRQIIRPLPHSMSVHTQMKNRKVSVASGDLWAIHPSTPSLPSTFPLSHAHLMLSECPLSLATFACCALVSQMRMKWSLLPAAKMVPAGHTWDWCMLPLTVFGLLLLFFLHVPPRSVRNRGYNLDGGRRVSSQWISDGGREVWRSNCVWATIAIAVSLLPEMIRGCCH